MTGSAIEGEALFFSWPLHREISQVELSIGGEIQGNFLSCFPNQQFACNNCQCNVGSFHEYR